MQADSADEDRVRIPALPRVIEGTEHADVCDLLQPPRAKLLRVGGLPGRHPDANHVQPVAAAA